MIVNHNDKSDKTIDLLMHFVLIVSLIFNDRTFTIFAAKVWNNSWGRTQKCLQGGSLHMFSSLSPIHNAHHGIHTYTVNNPSDCHLLLGGGGSEQGGLTQNNLPALDPRLMLQNTCTLCLVTHCMVTKYLNT